MGQGETSLLADPKVGFYIDGVFMSKTVGAVFDVVDLERIEVLRGPQGTLFGRNTTGGAVNVTTKKPTGELGGKAEASVGNFGYMRYGGSLDLPAVANLAAKLSYNHMETDGWADNDYDGPPQQPATSVEEDLASEDNDSYRIALRWTPSDEPELRLRLRQDRQRRRAGAVPDRQGARQPVQLRRFRPDALPLPFLGGSLYQQMAATVGDPDKRRDDYELDAVTNEWLEVEGHTLHRRLGGHGQPDAEVHLRRARDRFRLREHRPRRRRLHARATCSTACSRARRPDPGARFQRRDRQGHHRDAVARIPAHRQGLRRPPALHRRPVLLRGGDRAGQPADLLDPDRVRRHPGRQHAGARAVVQRGGFLPARARRRRLRRLAAPADPGRERPLHRRHERLLLRPGHRVVGGLRPDHLCRHRAVRPDARHPLHRGRERGVPLQPEHCRLHQGRPDHGRRQVGQHQLQDQRQLRDHG